MDTLQTQQAELEKAGTASVRGWKTKALGGRACLTAGEGADEQVSEVTELVLRGSSCSDGEEGEEEFAERETGVGNEPASRTRFSGQGIANAASQAVAELKARRLRTLRQMRKGQHFVALHACQALQLIISDRTCRPEVVNGVGGHMDYCCLLCGRTMPQDSLTEIDHGRTSQIAASICSTHPLGERC